MIQTTFKINQIPAILYGEPTTGVYLFVHGKMGFKEEAEEFAKIACARAGRC